MERARHLEIRPKLEGALEHLRGALRLALIVGLLLAAVSGVGAALAALGGGQNHAVNFFWVLGSCLGLHLLTLLAWVLFIWLRPSSEAGVTLGAWLWRAGRRLSYRLHRDQAHAATSRALGSMLSRSGAGRWGLSAVSHGLWLTFLTAAALMVLLLLSTRHYTFGWETTILSADAYVPLTRALAALPAAIGLRVPSEAQIRDSEWPGIAATSDAWAALLLGCLLLYGILPRLVLLLLCLFMARRAGRRFRLDTALPGYALLAGRLQPGTTSLGVTDPAPSPESEPVPGTVPGTPPTAARLKPGQAVALLGLELETPASGWPLPADVDWLDLGLVDSHKQRSNALAVLQQGSVHLGAVLVCCDLAATPDRGTLRFLTSLVEAAGAPLLICLSGGQRLRERSSAQELELRVQDWHDLASRAGAPEQGIFELDLDHWTADSATLLRTRLGFSTVAPQTVDKLPAAFDLIVRHVRDWTAQPSPEQQAQLHREIARLYGGGWRSLLGMSGGTGGSADRLRKAAEGTVRLLPQRLRSSRRWVVAGAVSGALAGVTTGLLVAPAALASLPMWSGFGAAVGGLLKSYGAMRPEDEDTTPVELDLGDAVRAAALFSLLLQLQGRGEATIGRILDQVLVEEEEAELGNAEQVAVWLGRVRQRFDAALAEDPV